MTTTHYCTVDTSGQAANRLEGAIKFIMDETGCSLWDVFDMAEKYLAKPGKDIGLEPYPQRGFATAEEGVNIMKLLIDADYIVYKSCAGAEDEIDFGEDVILVISKFSEALSNVQRELSKIKNNFMWDTPELVLFFSDSKNFREKNLPRL